MGLRHMKITDIQSRPLGLSTLCLLALFCFVHDLWSQTHIGGWINGTLTREGSPYHADDGTSGFGVRSGDTLVIEPGVVIQIPWRGTIIVEGVILALGTSEEPVHFGRLGNRNWIGLFFDDTLRTDQQSNFEWCIFSDTSPPFEFADGPPSVSILSYYHSIIFSACIFRNFREGISSLNANEMIINNCYFVEMAVNGRFAVGTAQSNTFISNTAFYRVRIGISTAGAFSLHNCIFKNCDVSVAYDAMDPDDNPLSITACIFVSGRNTIYIYDIDHNLDADNFPNIEYSNFSSEDVSSIIQVEGNGNIQYDGFAIPSRTNANGDSTDRYGNLLMDPGIVEGWQWPDTNFLAPDSPCIDAGDPEADPDPDGTIADIGPFYFPQGNLAADPREVYLESPEGARSDTLFISNIGLRNLSLRRVTLESETPDAFVLFGGIEDEQVLEPGDSMWVYVMFRAEVDGEYVATILIESDDRDEARVEIPVRAVSLSIPDDGGIGIPPYAMRLSAYPNPFNATAVVTLILPEATRVSLLLRGLNGRTLRDLGAMNYDAGSHRVIIEGNDLPAGIYLLTAVAGSRSISTQVVLLK
ncbi:MAG: hypothetical protein FJY67_01520 [Calditrichaeota bacterium]|nr:hypothetical protein [Calditrichota bacterium]